MNDYFSSKENFKRAYKDEISHSFGRNFEEAHPEEKYVALGKMITDYVNENWRETKNAVKEQRAKQLYYFSMEFLLGRLMTNNLMNLGVYDVVRDGLEELGINIH